MIVLSLEVYVGRIERMVFPRFTVHVEMRPANDPQVDYKDLVRRSYDACAAKSTVRRENRTPSVELRGLTARLEDRNVGVGCGLWRGRADRSGIEPSKFQVTGVDVSREMIEIGASKCAGRRKFVCGDVMSAEFEDGSFDAAVAFYSIFHLPREEHRGLFERIHRWLRPGGYFLCT